MGKTASTYSETRRRATRGLLLFGLAAALARPDAIIGFDQFADSQLLTTQIPGITFRNTIVQTAGISLNEFQLPPRSDPNVARDDSGPISISFSSPIPSFSGFFTYATALEVSGFAGNVLVASAHSKFDSNLALSGDPGSSPNELIEISSSTGFSRVTIMGSPAGGSFAMDDISFQSVPEPGTCEFLVIGALSLFGAFRAKRG